MCGENSKNFCCVTALWILGLFVTSLLNMVFSILNSKDYKEGYDEMNSDVNKNNNLLMGFGIAILSYVALNIVIIIPSRNEKCFQCECSDRDCHCDCPECDCDCVGACCWLCICCCQCFNCCLFCNQAKRFFNEFLPSLILSIISLLITISKMKTYNKYSKEGYDDDDFKKSKAYNLDMFICLLTHIIITVLYPIIVLMVATKNNDNLLISKVYKTNNTKNIPRNNIQSEPIMYVPPYNIVNSSQNNLQY